MNIRPAFGGSFQYGRGRLFLFAMNTIINGDLELEWVRHEPYRFFGLLIPWIKWDVYRVRKTIRRIASNAIVEVKAGTEVNGSSTPPVLWFVFGHPLSGDQQVASTFHDDLCVKSESIEDRNMADAVFRSLLKMDGVGFWKRLAMYAAVRAAGWWSFMGSK